MNTTALSEISFPVFKLPGPPTEEGGVIFYETYLPSKDEISVRIVDDLNIRKPTLGLRRMQLAKQGKKLFRFKTAVYSLGDLVRLSTHSDIQWVDSKGKMVRLDKSQKFKLEFRKITATFQKVGYTILVLKDEVQRFRSIYGPPSRSHGAVLLVKDNIKLFYGYALQEAKLTYKKI